LVATRFVAKVCSGIFQFFKTDFMTGYRTATATFIQIFSDASFNIYLKFH